MQNEESVKTLEGIARKFAQRSKKQRNYFEEDDDVRQSRKVKGLLTSGRETYGLQKIFIYVPVKSNIPLDSLSDLLSRIDGKLEKGGRFKRILSPYGNIQESGQESHGSILTSHFKIGTEQWLAALTRMTEPGLAPSPLTLISFTVSSPHVLGTTTINRPRRHDPVIVVAPHRHIIACEKSMRAIRAFRNNLTWILYDAEEGWSIETKFFRSTVVCQPTK